MIAHIEYIRELDDSDGPAHYFIGHTEAFKLVMDPADGAWVEVRAINFNPGPGQRRRSWRGDEPGLGDQPVSQWDEGTLDRFTEIGEDEFLHLWEAAAT